MSKICEHALNMSQTQTQSSVLRLDCTITTNKEKSKNNDQDSRSLLQNCVNSLASSPPEHSTEAVPFYPTPSGTGTHFPLMQQRQRLLTLLCHVPPTDQSTSFVVVFRERMNLRQCKYLILS